MAKKKVAKHPHIRGACRGRPAKQSTLTKAQKALDRAELAAKKAATRVRMAKAKLDHTALCEKMRNE